MRVLFASISTPTKVVIGNIKTRKLLKRLENENHDTKSYRRYEKNFFRGKGK